MGLGDSESFGVEAGYGERVIGWINEQAAKRNMRFEARLYGYELRTANFGTFEMFSWMGDVQSARRLAIRASKRFRIRIIEGGYKTKEKTLGLKKSDYGMVRRGERIIGHVEFEASRLGRETWKIKREERR